MKYLYPYALAFTVLALSACAGSENTAPVTTEGFLLPAEAPGGTSAEPSLATQSFLAPDASGNVAQPAPLDAKFATPVDTSSSGSSGNMSTEDHAAQLASPTPPEPPSVPLPAASASSHESAPFSPAEQPALSPVVPGTGTATARGVREEYREYRDRIETRAANENALEDRALFPHEDGAFQLSIDYLPSALDGLDFDPGVRTVMPSTQGGALGLTYFPLRSLSWGRLGLGAQGGAYWTKYEYLGSSGLKENSHKHSARSYGAKLQYEFQYFIGQLFVPFVQYGYDRISLRGFDRTGSGFVLPKRSIGSTFYGGGLQLNLNRLEPSSSSKALVSSGVRKFYLAYTFQQRKYDTESGTSHVLGLRFEY